MNTIFISFWNAKNCFKSIPVNNFTTNNWQYSTTIADIAFALKASSGCNNF